MTITEAHLVLADGTTFEGEAIGHLPESGVATGEVFQFGFTGGLIVVGAGPSSVPSLTRGIVEQKRH